MRDTERQRPTILMICNNFRKDPASGYLTNELADALVAAGADVIVGVIDWTVGTGYEPEHIVMPNGVEALFVAPRAIRGLGGLIANASKWLGASAFMMRALSRTFGKRQVDMMISFSPLVTTAFPILWAKRHFRCRGFAYITDFFPLHQQAAGQIKGGLPVAIGLALENMVMRRFETIACMSPAGVSYLREHYRLRSDQVTPVLRLWGDITPLPAIDRRAIRARYGLPPDRPIILFGGQISEGRGIEELLEMAGLAAARNPDLLFLLLGEGRLDPLVRNHIAAGGDNVVLHPPVARDDYLSIAAASDIGLVATIGDTGVPTFPSKTIDYLRAGLPVVASIEATTDYGAFITDNGFGIPVVAGATEQWLEAIVRIIDTPGLRETMVASGRRALAAHFDVAQAARTIVEHGFASAPPAAPARLRR